VPANVVATPNSTQAITLSWSASQDPKGVSSYMIFRGTSSSNLVLVATVHGTSLSYKNSGLTASTTYYYGVEASQASYISAMSSIVAATTIGLPNAPTSVVATANSSSKVTVTWTETVLSGGLPIGSYQIYRGTSPGNLVQVGVRTTASYIDTTVSPLATYYYAVTATDTSNDVSAKSASAVVVVP
jgi:fibronectin type 3 domain-containing protein